MKKTVMVTIMLSVLLIGNPTLSYAEKDPNRQTFFNSFGDWFATVGKSTGEKIQIKRDRKAARRAYRQEKKRQKNMAKTHKKMKKQNQAIMKRITKRKSIPNRKDNMDLR